MRHKLGLGSLVLLGLVLVVVVHVPAQAQGFKVTTGNAVDLGATWAEITTVAFGPDENPACPEGRLFFAAGHDLIATDLNGQAVAWPDPAGSPNPRFFRYPSEPEAPALIYDGHLVKLKDGSLLLTAEATTWNDNVVPRPDWWQQTVEFPIRGRSAPGGRGNIYVHRSEDCGRTWTRAGDVDAATLEVTSPSGVPTTGLCGTPRLVETLDTVLVTLPNGMKLQMPTVAHSGITGGWDGHFLYADPYNGNLFLSTPCDYGTGKVNEARKLMLLMMSSNRGDSWKVIRQIDPQTESVDAWRMPITSLPNGQVGLAYLSSALNELKLAVIAPPYDTGAALSSTSLIGLTPGSIPNLHIRTGIPGYSTLVGLPGKGFLVAAPHWNAKNKETQVFQVRRVTLALPGQKPLLVPAIEAPGLGDVVQGTLVEGKPATDLHAFYWVERIPEIVATKPSRFRVKFQLFKGTTALLRKPGELTLAHGKPYTYDPGPFDPEHPFDPFMGDYMGGAWYAGQDGSQSFVMPWIEQGHLRFNTVTLTPQVLSLTKLNPVDVQIVSRPVPVQRLFRPAPPETMAEPVRRSPRP